MKVNFLLYFFLCVFLFFGCSEEETAPGFTIETEGTITLDSDADSETAVSFTSAREWQASTTSEWLSISPASGDAGTCSIVVKAKSNNDSKEIRKATIILTSVTLTQEFTIGQWAGDYVELEQDTYNITAEGETLEIRFTTNVDTDKLAIYGSEEDWLTQKAQTRSAGSYFVNLTVLPNTGGTRTAYVLFYKETDRKQTLLGIVTIVQEGASSGSSTDYSKNKTVRVLQNATMGNGLPIVIMGDGFIDTEIEDGTYDKVMDKAMENLFTEEPMKSLRDYFNVYAVTAVSKHNNFGNGYETVFSCELEGGTSTGISGDDETIMEYVGCVEGIDLAETLVVVILNSPAYAGTTYFGYSDQSKVVEFAIAYCPVIYDLESESFRQVLVHEAVGHGFAKLEDEYSYTENKSIPSSEIRTVQHMQTLGWAQNVDFTTDESEVLWSTFLNDSRYSSEKLGIYEGACTYMKGVYRSTKESMMNGNVEGFNAPSRKAIYDMVMKRGNGKEPTYEEFAVFDRRIQSQTKRITRSVSTGKPFARPQFVNKHLMGK